MWLCERVWLWVNDTVVECHTLSLELTMKPFYKPYQRETLRIILSVDYCACVVVWTCVVVGE